MSEITAEVDAEYVTEEEAPAGATECIIFRRDHWNGTVVEMRELFERFQQSDAADRFYNFGTIGYRDDCIQVTVSLKTDPKKYILQMRPIADEGCDAASLDALLKGLCDMDERIRVPVMYGVDDGILWNVIEMNNVNVQTRVGMRDLRVAYRAHALLNIANGLKKMHDKGIVNGNVSYSTTLFYKNSGKITMGAIIGHLYTKAVDDISRMELIKNDISSLGLLMLEFYEGRELDHVTSERLDSLIGNVQNESKVGYLTLIRDMIFGDIKDMGPVIGALKELDERGL